MRDTEELEGPLGTPLGLSQRKRASPRGEAGTSGFLSFSNSDHRVPAELGQESQASSCLSTLGSSLRSPAEVEGNEAFPPQPQKDLEPSTVGLFQKHLF